MVELSNACLCMFVCLLIDLARPGVQLFGLLLRAYIYNNSKLSYSNFLARMSAFRCKPNMVGVAAGGCGVMVGVV